MLVRPQDGKAKMCLRDIHFCLHLELFVYNRVEIMTKYPNFQSCLRGLEVRLKTAMLEVPGSNLTLSRVYKKIHFYNNFSFF